MLKFGNSPYLECSSSGDCRFSALYARIRARNYLTIEQIYQSAKVFENGKVYSDWRDAKGKTCINIQEVTLLYSQLWDEYISENPRLLRIINEFSGFSDIFGQEGHNCQAREIWRIKMSNPNHF